LVIWLPSLPLGSFHFCFLAAFSFDVVDVDFRLQAYFFFKMFSVPFFLIGVRPDFLFSPRARKYLFQLRRFSSLGPVLQV